MNLKITKRYKVNKQNKLVPTCPFITLDIFNKHIVIIPFIYGKWHKWQIKKGFSNTVYKFHPFEMCVYY